MWSFQLLAMIFLLAMTIVCAGFFLSWAKP
jgi:hypothetical protein